MNEYIRISKEDGEEIFYGTLEQAEDFVEELLKTKQREEELKRLEEESGPGLFQ